MSYSFFVGSLLVVVPVPQCCWPAAGWVGKLLVPWDSSRAATWASASRRRCTVTDTETVPMEPMSGAAVSEVIALCGVSSPRGDLSWMTRSPRQPHHTLSLFPAVCTFFSGLNIKYDINGLENPADPWISRAWLHLHISIVCLSSIDSYVFSPFSFPTCSFLIAATHLFIYLSIDWPGSEDL